MADLQKYEIVEITIAAIDKWVIRRDIPAARRDDLMTLARLKRRVLRWPAFALGAKPTPKKKVA